MLKHEDAWSGGNSKSPNPLDSHSYSKPETPDSGLAPSLKEGKDHDHGEPFPNESARSETPSSVQSSGKGSYSTYTAGDNDGEDVFDEKISEAQTSNNNMRYAIIIVSGLSIKNRKCQLRHFNIIKSALIHYYIMQN